MQTTTDGFTALAIQPNGKIITRSDFALARLNRIGSVDQSFGHNGSVTLPFAPDNVLPGENPSPAIQPDGKLVVAGTGCKMTKGNLATGTYPTCVGNHRFYLARYRSNGSLDTSFGNRGLVRTQITGQDEVAALAFQPDGKIVVAGWGSKICPAGSQPACSLYYFDLVRYNPNGNLDTSFGTGGKVATLIGARYRFAEEAHALVIQPDEKIVVAGGGYEGPGFELVRYNPDGSLDASFGAGGIVTTSGPFSGSTAYTLVLQPDGKLVAAGGRPRNCPDGAPPGCGMGDFALARYTADGSLDTSFGSDGTVTTRIRGDDEAEALVLQPDGKLVAAGAGRIPAMTGDPAYTTRDFGIVRYNSDGSLDTRFGHRGIATMGSKLHYAEAAALALQPDGKLLVAGSDAVRTGGAVVVGCGLLVRLNG